MGQFVVRFGGVLARVGRSPIEYRKLSDVVSDGLQSCA